MGADQNHPVSEAVPDAGFDSLPVAELDQLSLSRLKRLRLLRKERDPLLQAELYRQLQYFSNRLPEALGELEPLEAYAPPPRPATEAAEDLAPFWRAIRELLVQGPPINHAKTQGYLALRLRDLRPLLTGSPYRMAIDSDLRRALKKSAEPRFVCCKKVQSAITGKTVHCWFFHDPE